MTGRAELILTLHEAIDGDFLIGCGLSVGNEDGDVALNKARISEVVNWAARTVLASDWLRDRDAMTRLMADVATAGREADAWDEGLEALTAKVREVSKGEPETWGFVAMIHDMAADLGATNPYRDVPEDGA